VNLTYSFQPLTPNLNSFVTIILIEMNKILKYKLNVKHFPIVSILVKDKYSSHLIKDIILLFLKI